MNDTLFKIARYLRKPNPSLKAHFYRKRGMLEVRCSEIQIAPWMKSVRELRVAADLAKFGPLMPQDFPEKQDRKIASKWLNRLPQDRNYFKLLCDQQVLWRSFRDRTLEDFLNSHEGKRWYRMRLQMTRKPTFELDMPYKRTKEEAYKNELKVREMIRENPLLQWVDLKKMNVRNAQAIYERFPHRELYRERVLADLTKQIGDA
jgi:hypothetical protein